MGHFAVYLGPPVSLDSLLTRAANTDVQSFRSHGCSDPVNDNGFGVAWYTRGGIRVPAVFHSIAPVGNAFNLKGLAQVTRSDCILANVHAASPGSADSETTGDPIAAATLTFMHNGSVGGFSRIKRALLASLSDDAFGQIEGSSDSEHVFAVFLDEYRAAPDQSPEERLAAAMTRTIQRVVELTSRAGVEEPSYLNLTVSDGYRAVVSRFATGGQTLAPPVYLHFGRRIFCPGRRCASFSPDDAGGAILISSEPLDDGPRCLAVPNNSIVVIGGDSTAEVRACPQAPFLSVG